MKLFQLLIYVFITNLLFAQPSNDDCVNAMPIGDGDCLTVDNTGATFDNYVGACFDDNNNIWFSFVADGSFADIVVNGVSQPEIFVSTAPSGGNPCDINDAVGLECASFAGNYSEITASLGPLNVGQTYYIQVTNNNTGGGSPGNVTVCLDNPPNVAGDICEEAAAFCSDSPETFEASTNTTAPTGPDYGCLGSQPNPTWFYLEIGQDGDIVIDLTPSPSVDIDYAVWGPYSDVATGCSGILSGNDGPTDCSFSALNNETVNITGALAGQTYILMVTNYSGDSTQITAEQTSGGGSTDCSVLGPCNLVANAGQDDSLCFNGTVDLNGSYTDNAGTTTVEWTSNPAAAAGDLSSVSTLNPTFNPSAEYGVVEFILTATDTVCSNADTVYIQVVPNISGLTCPGDLTATCDITEQPAYADFDAFIAAGGSATIDPAGQIDSTSFVLLDESTDGLSCPETVTRTYQIADTCGATVTCTQDIVIHDLVDPTGTAPADSLVECSVPAADPSLITDAADNCTPSPVVTFVGDNSDGLTCPETIIRTYRITDECGNFLDVTQTFTVTDTTAPTGIAPLDVTVSCDTDVPVADPTAVTGEADNCATPIVTHVGDVSDGNTCNGEIITRTYRIADDCGNFIEVDQLITIDAYAPTFTVTGTNPTACGANDGTITLSNLDPNTDYTFSYNGGATTTITTNGSGEYIITNLPPGTYTDFIVGDIDCPTCTTTDNSSIELEDPNSPTVDAGLDQEVCEGSSVTLTAFNPDGAVISWNNGVSDGVPFTPAPGTVTYTVTADASGCINTDAVNVTVVPTIDGLTCPGQLTAVCDISEQPAYADFDAFIADGGSVAIDPTGVIDSTSFILLDESTDGLSCPETVTRTYQIADTCGATVTCTQNIVIHDLVDPTGTAPADVTVQCAGNIPTADPTLITDEADNCTSPTVTHVGDVSDGNTCPEVITRTYRIEDGCNNFIEVQQLITVNDDTDPTASNPAALVVDCDTDVPAPDVTVVTDEADNCTATPVVTFVADVSDGNTCDGEIITRTYRITDDCGNFTEVNQTITISAVTPTITVSYTDPTGCGANDGTITISGLDANTDYNFSYNSGGSTVITSDASGDYVLTGLSPGSYTEFVVGLISCPSCFVLDNTVVNLIDPGAPTVDAGEDQTICEGEEVVLTADNPDGATISWDNGVVDGEPFTPGVGTVTYTVTATGVNGCESTSTVVVTVEVQPIASFDADPISGNPPLEVNFTNNSSGGTDYSWNFGNGQTANTSTPDDMSTIYSTEGTYQVILVVTNGNCSDNATATILVEELPVSYNIPNVITPNGDGSNDVLHMNLVNAKSVTIEIFNRWGNLVGTVNSVDPEKGWDGTDENTGKPVSDGTYFYTYKIEKQNGEIIEGHHFLQVLNE